MQGDDTLAEAGAGCSCQRGDPGLSNENDANFYSPRPALRLERVIDVALTGSVFES